MENVLKKVAISILKERHEYTEENETTKADILTTLISEVLFNKCFFDQDQLYDYISSILKDEEIIN